MGKTHAQQTFVMEEISDHKTLSNGRRRPLGKLVLLAHTASSRSNQMLFHHHREIQLMH
jgi:hypothetical protein